MSGHCWFKIIKINNVYAYASTNHPSLIHDLYNFLSIYVDGYRFMPKYKMGIWDGKVHFMDRSGKFPIGLIKYVYKFIQQDDVKVEMDHELLVRQDVGDLADITNEWMSDKFVPYHHQFEGAIRALKYRNCILEHATSAGKSLTMSMIIMYPLIKKQVEKVLVLVPGTGLVKQLTSDFIDYGVPADWLGQFYGLQKDTEQPIIISTWQSMCRQPELIKEFQMILADETHNLHGNVVRSVAENAVNAFIRIGCTGTMPDSKASKMQIEGALGPVVHQVTARELIDAKQASDISIKIPFITYSKKVSQLLKGVTYDVEKNWLETCDDRNNIIKKIVDKHHSVDHNVLILVDHLEHAQTLFSKFEGTPNVHAFMVTGATPPDERERIRLFTNENKKVIIVATYGVFSTGISIKRLHAVIFGSAGKSKIRTLQSIGRGLRLHDEKKKLILYDIGDNLPFSEKHIQTRVDIYTKAEFELDMFEINLSGE